LAVVGVLVDWFFDLLQAGINLITAPLPADSTNVVGYIHTITDNLAALNYFLPIGETFAIVVAILFLFPIFFGVSLALWVLAQLRGSSSRG
jgi:hypothetical protein